MSLTNKRPVSDAGDQSDVMMTYLVSEVEVDQNNWISRDRGFDPKTDKQIWGSEHGLLRFKRIENLSTLIQDDWKLDLI